MSISKIITEINKHVPDIGGKVYGQAHSIVRRQGTEQDMLPGIINKDGEVEYVGLDDNWPVIIYHKSNSISVTLKGGTGDQNDFVNTYNNSMIVYSDRKRTGMEPGELLLFLQANFPDTISLPPYKSIGVRFVNAIMNDQIVFSNEYQGTDFKLPPNKNIFQINYLVESSFKKNCFSKCP